MTTAAVLIPFRSDDPDRIRNVKYVLAHVQDEWPISSIIQCMDREDFNRSRARNVAAKGAYKSAEVFIFLDADSIVDVKQIELGIEIAKEHGWCFPYNEYRSLSREGTINFLLNIPLQEEAELYKPDYDYIFPSADHPEPSVGGCIIVHRDAWGAVGGWDERFIGWGEEDRAFALSLDTLIHPEVRVPGPLYHLWHPWSEEECFEQPHFMENRVLCNRYRLAQGDQAQMWSLVVEHNQNAIR